MEYQVKKKQILEQVEYKNLLGFTLVENKLERNFKSLVDAIMLTQGDTQALRDMFVLFQKQCGGQIKGLNSKIAQLQKKMESTESVIKSNANVKVEASQSEIEEMTNMKSQPKMSLKQVKSVKDTQLSPQSSSKNVDENMLANYQKMNDDRYNQLKQMMDKFRLQQSENSNIGKQLSNMKDNLNLLRAEVKTMSERSQKSIKRVSINNGNITNNQMTPLSAAQNNQESAVRNSISTKNVNNNTINGQDIDRQLNNIHIQLNTLKLCLQELKESSAQGRRKDGRYGIQIQQLNKNMKKVNQKINEDYDSLTKQIKELKMQILSCQPKTGDDSISSNKKPQTFRSKRVIQQQQPNANKQNHNGQINDRISKLQNTIQGLVTQTQFKRFKNQVKQKLATLQNEDEGIRKQMKDEIQMIMELFDGQNDKLVNINKEIEALKEQCTQVGQQGDRKNNITNSRIQQLKKNLQNLKEDLQFYKTMNEDNMSKAQQSGSGQFSGEDNRKSKSASGDSKSAEQLKKYFNRKLHDQRNYLLGLIRDMEKKSSNKNGFEQDVISIWDKLSQINLFLNKKANEQDVKKHLTYLDKKLSSIYNHLSSQDENNDDARIAKTNWLCLSCDKTLHNYQGKMGKHIVWDSMPIKQGNAKYYPKSDDKKSLPTLKR